jgi:hypothetical protein
MSEEDSTPRALLRAARHVESFVESYARTVRECLLGERATLPIPGEEPRRFASVPRASLESSRVALSSTEVLTPAVFLLLSYALLFVVVISVTLASRNERLPSFGAYGLEAGLAWCFIVGAIGCGFAVVLFALLAAADRGHRVAYIAFIGSLGTYALPPGIEWLVGGWSVLLVLGVAAWFHLPHPLPAEESRNARGQTALRWTLVFVGSVTAISTSFLRASSWRPVSEDAEIAVYVLLGVLILLSALIAASFHDSSRRLTSELLRASSYRVGVALFLQVPLVPIAFLYAGSGGKAGLPLILLIFYMAMHFSFEKAASRLRRRFSVASIFMLATLGVFAFAAPLSDAWAGLRSSARMAEEVHDGYVVVREGHASFVNCEGELLELLFSSETPWWRQWDRKLKRLVAADLEREKKGRLAGPAPMAPVRLEGKGAGSRLLVRAFHKPGGGDRCRKGPL